MSAMVIQRYDESLVIDLPKLLQVRRKIWVLWQTIAQATKHSDSIVLIQVWCVEVRTFKGR